MVVKVMKKNKYGLIFVSLFLISIIVYLVYTNKLNLILDQIKNLELKWLLFSLMAIFGYWFVEAIIINTFVKSTGKKQNLFQAFKVTIIGQFANGVTPFASGGQPAQLFILAKQNLSVSRGASVLMSKFIVYQGTLVFYTIFLLVLKARFFLNNINNLFTLVLLGFGINFIVIGSLVFLSKAKNINKKIIEGVILLSNKLKLVKRPAEKIEKLNHYIEDFHDSIVELNNNKTLLLKAILYTFIQLSLYFLVPYFLYRSFGLQDAYIINFIAATAFVLMITSFVPIPGASGGAEGGFYLIFGTFFLSKYIATAIVLWRFITYYIGVFIGGLFIIPEVKSIE